MISFWRKTALAAAVAVTGGLSLDAAPAFWTLTTAAAPWVTAPLAETKETGTPGVEIDPSQPLQAMTGFGGCFNELGWTALQTLPAAAVDQVLRDLFSPQGCNFGLCRMPIGANDYAVTWYSLDETPGDTALAHFSLDRDEVFLLPYIRAAMKIRPGLQVWGSAWSPPSWMKTGGTYHGGSLRWEKPVLEAYAAYLSRAASAYRAHGINFVSVHVQNEPFSEQVFPSCVWNADQIAEFVGSYLGPRFARDKPGADLWLGTLNNGSLPFLYRILDDPKAAPFLAGAGFQWAGRSAVAPAHQKYPALPLMQTESECGNGSDDWKAAAHTWSLVRDYVSNGARGSYMYWNMVLDETGLSTWGWKQNALVTVDRHNHAARYNPEFYVMKHLAHFVLPQARFLAARGDWPDTLAFRNPDGTVAVLLANFTGQPATVTLRVAGKAYAVTLPDTALATAVLPGS